VLGISVSIPVHLPVARSTIAAVRRSLQPAPPIVVGGSIFVRTAGLSERIGADAVALDARHGLALLEELAMGAS
jgi:hypothetical protein